MMIIKVIYTYIHGNIYHIWLRCTYYIIGCWSYILCKDNIKDKKDTEESLDEIEDYTASVSELNDKVEALQKKLEDVDKKHDNVNEGIYRNIEQLDSNQEEIYLRLSEFEDEDEEDTE